MEFFKKHLNYISESLFDYEERMESKVVSEVRPIVERIKEERKLIIEQEKNLLN